MISLATKFKSVYSIPSFENNKHKISNVQSRAQFAYILDTLNPPTIGIFLGTDYFTKLRSSLSDWINKTILDGKT